MTAAPHFANDGYFRTCLRATADLAALYPTVYWVRNLTLNQVMKFYYSVETFTLTTSASVSGRYPPPGGTLYSGTATGTITLSPLGFTGDWASLDVLTGNRGQGWMLPDASLDFALGQTSRIPGQRACRGSSLGGGYYLDPVALNLIFNDSTGSLYAAFDFFFVIAKDSVNSGKYAVGIFLSLRAPVMPGPTWDIAFSHASGARDFNSGTFQIGGITFPYYCGTSLPATSGGFTATGGTLSATSAFYTY